MKKYFYTITLFLIILMAACSGDERGGNNNTGTSDADIHDLDIFESDAQNTNPHDASNVKLDADNPKHDAHIEQDCEAIPMTQGPSQPCCIAYGIDACGPGLFCAAFDGRAQPACYVDRSRLDSESCGADKHCLSDSCNPTTDLCRAPANAVCTPQAGCVPATDNSRWICTPETNTPNAPNKCLRADLSERSRCGTDAVCASGICYDGSCSTGSQGASCDTNEQCANHLYCNRAKTCSTNNDGTNCSNSTACSSGFCIHAICTTGEFGAQCTEANHCQPGLFCANGTCAINSDGTGCIDHSHCGAGFCVSDTCTDGKTNAACNDDSHCSTIYDLFGLIKYEQNCIENRCSMGRGGSYCSTPADCFALGENRSECIDNICKIKTIGSSCRQNEDCQSAHRCSDTGVCEMGFALGQSCTYSSDCGTHQSDIMQCGGSGSSRVCKLPESARCTARSQCYSNSCRANCARGSVCSVSATNCTGNSDCSPNDGVCECKAYCE